MIISIGNISLGGTGKTPFVILIGKYFLEKGERVCVLSRGYKGKLKYDTNIISDGNRFYFTPPMAADEPYLIAKNLKNAVIITGKDRNKGYILAKEKFACNTFILDDGYQHRKMQRDVDILLLDYQNSVSTGLIFPFGYLREFPSSIKRADIIVFTKTNGGKTIPEKVKGYVKGKPIFFSDYRFTSIVSKSEEIPLKHINGEKVLTFSGIAKNKHFFHMLKSVGADIENTFSFRDHHVYTEKELLSILESAKEKDVKYIITTEKDYVKIPDNLKEQFYYAKIEIVLNDKKKFFEAIENTYKKKRP
ncbi:tetraacyldisaccharide 4'-kinase [Deferribacterales bacterium Es71-Z0220]|uniref:tetraacyldisaccharide 4'-kinase n=1 Tax=Deferrivibrio essentukiensis TaxID=2880922 RepID=UPI001F61B37E|nr:tetraacyldisaccharide 4'-kinase [Deferrivibrio essentukiensis]MCB4203998.1 tetraacyldisaccharide 4'-kinase [Deferrivibrio essentukiensis]